MGFVLESPLRRTHRARVVGVVLVVVLLLALAVGGAIAWYRSTRPNLDPDTGARSAAGVTVLVYTEAWGGQISTVGRGGRLAVLDGGCLGLTDGSLFVFPYGSKVIQRDGEVAVEVPYDGSRTTVGPGDVIGIGGATPGPVTDFGGHLADHVPAACRAREATSGIEFFSRGPARSS